MWLSSMIGKSAEYLGKRPMALLQAIVEIAGEPAAKAQTVTASKNAVLDRLERSEGKRMGDDALRQRIKSINDGLKSLAEEEGGAPPFVVKSSGASIELDIDQSARLDDQRARVIGSAWSDSQMDRTDIQEPYGSDHPEDDQLPQFLVFICHTDHDTELNAMKDDFVSRLHRKLRNLPHPFCNKFRIRVIYHHTERVGHASSFEAALLEHCRNAAAALYLISDSWFNRPAVLRERKILDSKIYFCVRLEAGAGGKDPKFESKPTFPQLCTSHENLQALWEGADSEKTELINRLREEICAELQRQFESGVLLPNEADKKVELRRGLGFLGHHDKVDDLVDPHGQRGRREGISR